MANTNKVSNYNGTRSWLAWRNGHFRHQRSAIRIPKVLNFPKIDQIKEHETRFLHFELEIF